MNRVCLSVMLFVISILHHPHTIRIEANRDSDALIAFKEAITDDPQNALHDWDPTFGMCTWNHVYCDDENNKNVIRVELGNYSLSGHLVPQLGNMQRLRYLKLYSNNLSGTIPAELGNLTNLFSLDLNENNLTGLIPETLGNTPTLTLLLLNDNNLSGPVPVNLAPIATSRSLDVSNNPYLCSDYIPYVPPCPF